MTALVLALCGGVLSGLALGTVGGGGGVLAVPVLVYLLGLAPDAAGTAALLVTLAGSLTALLAHSRDGSVRIRAGLAFAAAGLLPAAAGGLVAAHLPAPVLTGAFAVLAATAAVPMLRPTGTSRRSRNTGHRAVRTAAAGAGLGAVTGLLGVGGGFLAVPVLVAVLGFGMRAAVGTSLLVITVNSLAALATRGGSVTGMEPAVLLAFLAAAVLASWGGRHLAVRAPAALLQRMFGVLLLGVAAFMLGDALLG